MTGGPPVRGTKLLAWQVPAVWKDFEQKTVVSTPKNSAVLFEQKRLWKQTRKVLTAIACDVRQGLLETVGVESFLSITDKCSMMLELPAGTDAELITRAVDLENVEAWRDADGKVHIGISPWYSTKDVDQTVLSVIKVVHVLLGLHAGDVNQKPPTFSQKLLSSITEIMLIQKKVQR